MRDPSSPFARRAETTPKGFSRRAFGLGVTALTATHAIKARATEGTISFGLTPVFLTNDLELLTKLKSYLERSTGNAVQLVQRRTYEEITSLLLSGQLQAAWICGYPFVQYRDRLSLVAVPIWRGKPLYQSYLIIPKDREATDFEQLKGDLHAFSDPNSNSGYLVTAALLARQRLRPEQFFRQTFFTYGHRNVVRAVAAGLAQSGSVDGYVWEVMSAIEPELTGKTKVLRKSELLGFPPIACTSAEKDRNAVLLIKQALLGVKNDPDGQAVLNLLRLDGFSSEDDSLFDSIADEMTLVRSVPA
ncbi:PhnD/SsuA/transferrin family substrate-binding protein [Nordella sp. HKS 07]|nr:PhnD/SsuA/transferrin family substrate-binding protein [Nordella sp. HKS 07]QIG52286.1 PhnD/SsuA/transferrin family substrate-binding protein [Nordella sp. HKS 07]